MHESARRLIASTIAMALAVGLLATPVAAQPADEVTPTAGINADKVDGLHAVKATSNKAKRKNKLIATDSKGYLPGNIVMPLWSLIQGLPAILADGQVSWGELLGIPAGFADGVDDTGYASQVVWSGPVDDNCVYFKMGPMPRNVDYQFTAIPAASEEETWVEIVEISVDSKSDGSLQWQVEVCADQSTQVAIRATGFSQGIATAALQKSLRTADVKVWKAKKRHGR